MLYLYENRLTKIERLDPVVNLQLLYLQRNSIASLENLGHLTRLRKLYLSENCISVVEGLDKLFSLKGNKGALSFPMLFENLSIFYISELHVDNQKLTEGQHLVFDPRSCKKLQQLQVLNSAGNRMAALQPLQELRGLRHLDLGGNLLPDLAPALEVLSRLPNLTTLDLRGNPFASSGKQSNVKSVGRCHRRHWETVVGACSGLQELDGRRITPACRAMMNAMRSGKKVNQWE